MTFRAAKYISIFSAITLLFWSQFFPAPAIEFKTTIESFGTIKAGTKVIKEFKFKNAGTDTLRITTVQASDGGTIAYWPKDPIPPKVKGIIRVEFGYTETRRGFQDKSFTVISNAENNPVVLHLKGYIKK